MKADPTTIDTRLKRACEVWEEAASCVDGLSAIDAAEVWKRARAEWLSEVEVAIAAGGRPHTSPADYRAHFDQDLSTSPDRPPAFHEALMLTGGWDRYLVSPDGVAHNTVCYLLNEDQPLTLDWRTDLSGWPVEDAAAIVGQVCHVCYPFAELDRTRTSREWRLDP